MEIVAGQDRSPAVAGDQVFPIDDHAEKRRSDGQAEYAHGWLALHEAALDYQRGTEIHRGSRDDQQQEAWIPAAVEDVACHQQDPVLARVRQSPVKEIEQREKD